MVERTKDEMINFSGLSGRIVIAAAETQAFSLISEALERLQKEAPKITFEIISGNADHTSELLKNGLSDFGLFVGEADVTGFHTLDLEMKDTWGLICRKDSPIAEGTYIDAEQLKTLPLLVSSQANRNKEFSNWLKGSEPLNILGSFNLPYNAILMVRAGLGNLLVIKGVGGYEAFEELRFIPLKPRLQAKILLAWTKEAQMNLVSQRFFKHFKDVLAEKTTATLVP